MHARQSPWSVFQEEELEPYYRQRPRNVFTYTQRDSPTNTLHANMISKYKLLYRKFHHKIASSFCFTRKVVLSFIGTSFY